jgi:CHRD domain
VITAAQVQYLLYGWSYVNLTTAKFPSGEIRGQLDVRPPATVAR